MDFAMTRIVHVRVTSKVKGQGYNVTSSIWCVFVHSSTEKVAEASELAGRLSVPRLTFHTSYQVKRSKVKVIRPLNAVNENQPCHIFGRGSSASHHLQGAGYNYVCWHTSVCTVWHPTTCRASARYWPPFLAVLCYVQLTQTNCWYHGPAQPASVLLVRPPGMTCRLICATWTYL